MSYKHEIFISYKWSDEERKTWVREIFLPILQSALYDGLGINKDQIFCDVEKIVPGASLDLSLKDGIAHSKCMISILSLPYFNKSVWCPTEFSAMLRRENELEIRKKNKHIGLIFPVIFINELYTEPEKRSNIYKCVDLRKLIFNISPLEIDRKYNLINTAFKQGEDYNKLKLKIGDWVDNSIVPCLSHQDFPTWQPNWYDDKYFDEAYEDFKRDYNVQYNHSLPQLT